jgi:hypothetical protein
MKNPGGPAAFLCAALVFAAACSSQPSSAKGAVSTAQASSAQAQGPDMLTGLSGAEQNEVYSGEAKPFIVYGEGYRIRYYSSQADLKAGTNGSADAPVEPGRYYVRIMHPNNPGKYAPALLVIEKAPVAIFAEAAQQAVYNGSPKRVSASSQPSLPLSFSYYPSAEVRERAQKNFANPERRQAALSGFKRVERAPVEPGVYYVTVFYPGDERYHPAMTEVDFVIREAN